MKKFVLFLLCLVYSSIYAQETEITQQQNDYVSTVFMTRKKDYSDVKYQGTPYYHETPVLGTPFKKEVAQPKLLLQYNAYNDEIEIKDGDKTYSLLKSANVKAEINGEKFVIDYFLTKDGEEKEGYLIQLTTSGNAVLYYKPLKEYVPGKEPTSGYESYFPPQFVDKSEFYYRLNNSRSAQILKTKKKSLLQIFSDKEKEVKAFISANKLDLDERADLIKLFDYYNNLTQ